MMFHWDKSKRNQVLKEHGVDFAKIGDVFSDPYSIDYIDHKHSDNETRYGIIGKTTEYGLIVLIYTAIDEQTLKFVTARRAEKWMVNDYEEQRRRY